MHIKVMVATRGWGVASSRRVLGGVWFLRTLAVGFFYPTPEVELNYLLHRTPKLGMLTRASWNGTISFKSFIEADNSYCAARFPLIASFYKIADSQTLFTLCLGGGNLKRSESEI